jgi:hypothetical protein
MRADQLRALAERIYALSMELPDEDVARRLASRAADYRDLAEEFEIAETPERRDREQAARSTAWSGYLRFRASTEVD